MSKKIPMELIANELAESDLDGMTWMGLEIELKMQEEIEPVLVEILSYFRCERCGECCRSNPPGVSDEELIAMAKKTGKEAFDALDENVLMNAFRSPCHFLSRHGCKIYDIRPRVCMLYPFSLKNMGFITLVLCPLGKEIQKELENFIRSKGITKVRYEHDPGDAESRGCVKRDARDLRVPEGHPYHHTGRTPLRVRSFISEIPET